MKEEEEGIRTDAFFLFFDGDDTLAVMKTRRQRKESAACWTII
ncbi:hypothetical protein [Chordicoccus furentiruminis]|nr:hypothetical protein [Chordicoccus furentiruminis]